MKHTSGLGSFLAAAASLAPVVNAVGNLVDVGYAKYQGAVVDSKLGVSAWKGIQYAAPPVGDLRFAPPQDPVHSGTINATRYPPICPPSQPNDWTVSGTYDRFTVAEDCLYVNVHAPTKARKSSKLPVVVFFQGGGFTSQSSANWDPTEVVAEGQVVFVQFSYRVGMYGFLNSAKVTEAGGDINAGLRDQIKLLEWVQEHINQFGGDPDQVVLDGVSAGGSSVALMMAADTGKKLFAGGIMESGGWVTMRTPDAGEDQYQCLLNDKGCNNATDGVACLRALNESAIRTSNCWFNPNIDGTLYTDSLVNLFEQGKYAKVPTIMGSCSDEGTKYNAPETLDSAAEATTWIAEKDPSLSNSSISIINDLYAKPAQPTFPGKGRFWRHAAVAIGDIGTHCITRNIQNYLARDNVPTYNYKYAVQDPSDEAVGYGAWHTVNAYAFWGLNRTDGGEPASYFTTNKPIISVVRSYWTSFIRNLDPNTDRVKAATEWKPYTGPDSRERLFIQTNNTKMERMSPAQALRCDVVRPMSDNLGKPVGKGVATEFDAKLAAKVNSTSEVTSLKGKKKHGRDFSQYY
ncbi:alpha/beta-hydrolase [Corynespora cassiicola Philippines]|uniref:Carboxylic ester hydrolase n=1 Tax=Corynespora cassiicola Philippines TaxID=1448308 RepID=A0A2T2P7D0_CORCC|nr:alpha/beta-hydrolase [Corynespora cassiicola Philippines]